MKHTLWRCYHVHLLITETNKMDWNTHSQFHVTLSKCPQVRKVEEGQGRYSENGSSTPPATLTLTPPPLPTPKEARNLMINAKNRILTQEIVIIYNRENYTLDGICFGHNDDFFIKFLSLCKNISFLPSPPPIQSKDFTKQTTTLVRSRGLWMSGEGVEIITTVHSQ